MSKIYEALEKAERETGLSMEFSSILETEADGLIEPEMILKLKTGGGTISNQQLISYFRADSIASEQFRKLRTSLLQANAARPMKTIMVTSATPSEGKSTVAANLAVGIASDPQARALLVDCDLRQPTLASWFGLNGAKGLSDYLTEDIAIADLLRKTELERLRVLPAGTIQDSPSELFASKKMGALMHELKSRYEDRYIILDSTPLLPTTEPEVLAKWVDGIIVVVRAGATPRETVKQAISFLGKEKVLGFVLNDLQFKSSGLSLRYFGSDGYNDRYGYGYGKKDQDHDGFWQRIFRKRR